MCENCAVVLSCDATTSKHSMSFSAFLQILEPQFLELEMKLQICMETPGVSPLVGCDMQPVFTAYELKLR